MNRLQSCLSVLALSNITQLGQWSLHSFNTLLFTRAGLHTHTHTDALAHYVFYWNVSHFLLSEACPPFLPLSSCSASEFFYFLFYFILPPISSRHLSLMFYLLVSFLQNYFIFSYPFFSPSQFVFSDFLPFFFPASSCLFAATTSPLCWASGQCESETGCNYFTPPLIAVATERRERKWVNCKINRLIIYSYCRGK